MYVNDANVHQIKGAGLLSRLLFCFTLMAAATLSVATPRLALAQEGAGGAAGGARAGGDAGNAGGGGNHIGGLSFGHSILFGTWGDNFDSNFSFAGHYTYEATPIFGFMANVGISKHSGLTPEDSLTVLSIEPDVKVNLFYFDNVSLYTFGGFGLYPLSQTLGGTSASVLAFGINIGFGVDLRLGEHFVFGPGLVFKSIFIKRDSTAITTNSPTGMELGGEMLRLFVQAGYIF